MPKPDFSVQPGDDGGHDHGHAHAHDHAHEAHPPSAKTVEEGGKKCTLEKADKPTGPLCFNEPQCGEVCEPQTQQVCKPVTERQCQTRNVKSCNTITEEKCTESYLTQFENKCTTVTEKQVGPVPAGPLRI